MCGELHIPKSSLLSGIQKREKITFEEVCSQLVFYPLFRNTQRDDGKVATKF